MGLSSVWGSATIHPLQPESLLFVIASAWRGRRDTEDLEGGSADEIINYVTDTGNLQFDNASCHTLQCFLVRQPPHYWDCLGQYLYIICGLMPGYLHKTHSRCGAYAPSVGRSRMTHVASQVDLIVCSLTKKAIEQCCNPFLLNLSKRVRHVAIIFVPTKMFLVWLYMRGII